jgi:7-cyano-7-deazaguanine synthase in queuosine biosynthesis
VDFIHGPPRTADCTDGPAIADNHDMERHPTMIVNGGGLRSLTATAAALTEVVCDELVLLHLRDGRANAAMRADTMHRQARHYQITRVIEVGLPHLQTEPYIAVNQDGGSSPLTRSQTLIVAVAQAIRVKAGRLIWPVQINGDHPTIARAAEEVVLIEQLTRLEQQQAPAIDMPLVDLTDQQLIELGAQLDVPWELAWTCMQAGDRPCGVCAACQHRRAAFESAGILDPIEKQPAVR